MIPASPNRILLNSNGFAAFPFDIDKLHDQLSASFKANGVDNKWMADDILIALQNYMSKNKFSVRSDEDLDQIHAMVVKVLQDNGFSETAEHFSQNMRDSSINFLNRKIVDEFKNLNLPFSRENAANVLNKLLNLGYETAEISSLLIREICRLELHCHSKKIAVYENVSPADILPLDKKYVNWKWDYLQMRTAGSLFNSIRIDIQPLYIAQELELPVFIELVFMEKWEKLMNSSAKYLETCLYHLRDVSKQQVDYISIVVHNTESFVDFCKLGERPPLLTDMSNSMTSAFGGVIAKFSGLKLSSTQK